MTATPESPGTPAAESTLNTAGKGPWHQRNLDTATDTVARWLVAKQAFATAKREFEQMDAALKYAKEEHLLDPYWDEFASEYNFSAQGVVFTKAERRTWAMECYSDELQAAIKAEQEVREPKVSHFLRARLTK